MAHHLARGFKLEKWHPMCGATTLAAQFRDKINKKDSYNKII